MNRISIKHLNTINRKYTLLHYVTPRIAKFRCRRKKEHVFISAAKESQLFRHEKIVA